LEIVRAGMVVILPWWAGPHATLEKVPFVGCPADGQAGYVAPPQGAPKVLPLEDVPARGIAYYQGDDARGVFAPRGWRCRVWYGSGGYTILVTPLPIDSTHFPPPQARGHAVELSFSDGGTSGRFRVAEYASRLFPSAAAAFIERVKSEGLEPDSAFARGPYGTDSVRYLAGRVAEFRTPENTRGLGTEGILDPSNDAIRGIAVLDTLGDWGVSVLRVRLGSNLRQVEISLVRLNRECMQKSEGC